MIILWKEGKFQGLLGINQCRPPDPLIKLIYSMLFFIQFLLHLIMVALLINCLHWLNYSVEYKLCELKLSLNYNLKQLKLLDIIKASLNLPLGCYKSLWRKFHPLYADNLIFLWSRGLFLKNEKMLISTLFITVIHSL